MTSGEAGITEITNLSNMMYKGGCFSKMNTSVLITLPKVSGTTECEKHRNIRLMSHVSKLVLCVIYIYIYIYNRFIVRFPIGLDSPLITLPFQEC